MRYPLLAGLLALAPAALAQTTPADTTRLRYAEEELAAPPQVVPLPRQQARQQWKLGVNNFLLGGGFPFSPTRDLPAYYTRYGLHVAYERRLGRVFSVQAEASPAVVHYLPNGAAGGPVALAQLRAQLLGRYYFVQERRRRRGRRIEGGSGSYLGLALGLGLGSGPSETPYHLLARGTGPATDAALLFGVQRRLGRYGFLDLNAGLGAALRGGQVQDFGPVAGLRVGAALPAVARAAPQEAQPDEVDALLPRFFVGVQFGDGRYYSNYSLANPYPASYQTTVGGFEKTVNYPSYAPGGGPAMGRRAYDNDRTWYGYGGYYLRPRLALQVGVQVGASTYTNGGIGLTFVSLPGQPGRQLASPQLDQTLLALPVQVRYALTRSFRTRLQVEVVGGLAVARTGVHFREFGTDGYDVTDEVVNEFRRSSWTVAANAGAALGYGLGRRRRVQATLEYGLLQDLHRLPDKVESLATYAKIGLRYRFGYR